MSIGGDSVERAREYTAGGGEGTLRTYVLGFIFSAALTLLAYGVVEMNTAGPLKAIGSPILIGLVAILAFTQFLVQLTFFLHLGRERGPRWKLIVFSFMVLVVSIVIVGSLWIMYNLDYHMMPKTQSQIKTYMNSQDGL